MPPFADLDIESVVVPPDRCHRCGTELGTTEFEGRQEAWCPECDLVLSQNPIPGVHVIVHDEAAVLLLDEPIPQHEGVLSLPGGHGNPDESPEDAVLRELEEETGLVADPTDLSLVTVYHVEVDPVGFYFVTYSLDRADATGSLRPEAEGFEAAFHPIEAVRAGELPLRDSDRERIEMALDPPG